jgi:hypothetical protein
MKTDKKVKKASIFKIYPICLKCDKKCKTKGIGQLVNCQKFKGM